MENMFKYRLRDFDLNGQKYWFVYKLKSVCAPDETGNRIYMGAHFDNRQDAQKYADMLMVYGEDAVKRGTDHEPC